MKKVFNIFFTMVFILILFSCRIDINYMTDNKENYQGSENWMSKLDDNLRISKITLPGTHDSCANYDFLGLSSTSATQDLTLSEQLKAGVRCFDIRIYDDNGTYKIHHGPQYMHMTLDDVVSVCSTFLKNNPSEYLVLLFQGEYKTEGISVAPIIDELAKSDTQLFWQGTDANSAVLSQVRGKIIPGLRYRDKNRTACLDESTYLERGCRFKTQSPQDSWKEIKALLETAKEEAVSPYPRSVFTSTYFEGQFGIPNVRISSSYINGKLLEYLKNYMNTDSNFGIIATDHMTKELAHTIYSCNVFTNN